MTQYGTKNLLVISKNGNNMVKTIYLAILTVSFVATILAAGFVVHQAYSSPATIIDPAGLCGFADGDGNLYVTDDSRVVETQSAKGLSLLTCSATGVPNSQGQAVIWNTSNNPFGPNCYNAATSQSTTHWSETVSTNGNVKLQCHFKD